MAQATLRTNEWGPLWMAAFGKSDQLLVAVGQDGYVRISSLKLTGPSRSFLADPGPLSSLTLSADRNRAAVAAEHGKIYVWDLADERGIGGPYHHSDRACSAVFSPDERQVLTSGLDSQIGVWTATNTQTAERLARFSAYAAVAGEYFPNGKAQLFPHIFKWQKDYTLALA